MSGIQHLLRLTYLKKMLLLRNEKDWDHRKVLKKNIKGKYLIFWLNSRYKAMVRYGNLLLITNRHRIGQLDYTNANMSSLWPLDIRFFRYDVRIEKEIFSLPSQTWSRLGKKSWKTFCFFSIFKHLDIPGTEHFSDEIQAKIVFGS